MKHATQFITHPKLVISLTFSVFFALLSGCMPTTPSNVNNACNIFGQYPQWYWDALASYRKWGVPVSVQMAIIKQESHFVANARPPRKTYFWIIPGPRPSTAYGCSQALDGTWRHYITDTGNRGASRTDFGDATDFVGWYANLANRIAGISKRNAYNLYLAYHEGVGNYQKRTYRNKPWLMGVAKKVERQALIYRQQIQKCKYNIAKPSFWNLF